MIILQAFERSAIIAASASLPAAPQIMARLYKLLLDFNSGIKAISDLLKRDPALTARIIRTANSPAYGGGGIGSIEEALSRVGFGEVYRLVGSASSESLGRLGLKNYGYSADAFQRHNLFSALVAERLAMATKVDARAAYTCGLLRRIGQLLMDQMAGNALTPAESFPECGAGRVVEWERRTFSITHHDVAAILLAEWGFPDEIVAAAAHCHGEPGEMSRLAQVVDLMDNIVRLAGFGLSADESEWGLPGEKLTALGIDHDQAQQVKSEALVQLKFIEDAQRGG
jgi:HD-like signal output (HDOD) protein